MERSLKNSRFMIIGLADTRHQDKERVFADFEETESLIKTYGGVVYAAIVQNSARSDYETYIGTGKVEEAADLIEKEQIDIVVVNASIKASQLHALKLIFEKKNSSIQVWDRVDLILHIFSKHARTAEAKLQIRLAFMRHMGPRIYGMGMEMSQQAGGIGTRGLGETNTELMLRHWRNEMQSVRKELSRLSRQRDQQIKNRRKTGLLTISLVGYTNAGKSSLFNTLSRQNTLVEDALFATLDSTVDKFYIPSLQKEVYLSDTIGFIKDLPPKLIDAFKSTLMEAVSADLLLHVIDVTDPWMEDKIEAVNEILREIGADTKEQIFVFNKIDKPQSFDKKGLEHTYKEFHPVFVSAKSGEGVDTLLEQIRKVFDNASPQSNEVIQ